MVVRERESVMDVMRREGTWEIDRSVEIRVCDAKNLNVFPVQNSPFVSSWICWQVRGRESERYSEAGRDMGASVWARPLEGYWDGWTTRTANCGGRIRAVRGFFVMRMGSM